MKTERSFLENAISLGFGLVSVTREKVEKLSAELVKRGELSSREAREWVNQFEENMNRELKLLDEKVHKGSKDLIERLKLPSRSEFEKLTREVAKLRKEVSALKSRRRSGRKA
jgi:polyhydroxyalkanoate synthesis regulator phasin